MTQETLPIIEADETTSNARSEKGLWISATVILGLVFFPALIAWAMNLLH